MNSLEKECAEIKYGAVMLLVNNLGKLMLASLAVLGLLMYNAM